MKKIIAIVLLSFTAVALAQRIPMCSQRYICGPAGCQWVVVCN